MLLLVTFLNILLPFVYGITACLYGSYFVSKNKKIGSLASNFLLCGIIIHSLFLITKGWQFRHFPIENLFASLSMLAFDIATIYYITERLKKEYTTGIFFLSIVFLCQFTSTLLFRGQRSNNELLADPMFGVHVTFTLLGFSALAISSLYALMYCMLAKQIRKRQFGIVYEGLPPLETLDAMRQYATICGIALLGVGLLLGHVWAYKILHNFGFQDPKVVITDIAWFAYSIVFWWNWKNGVRGLRINILSAWLFVALFSAVVVLEFFLDTFHRFV